MTADLTAGQRRRLAEAATLAELETVAAEIVEVQERRDQMIAAAVDAGITQARVAEAVGLSRQRVQQIAAAAPDPAEWRELADRASRRTAVSRDAIVDAVRDARSTDDG